MAAAVVTHDSSVPCLLAYNPSSPCHLPMQPLPTAAISRAGHVQHLAPCPTMQPPSQLPP